MICVYAKPSKIRASSIRMAVPVFYGKNMMSTCCSNSLMTSTYYACSSVKAAIKRFSRDLARKPEQQLPEPAMLCAEILESAAARRTYQHMLG